MFVVFFFLVGTGGVEEYTQGLGRRVVSFGGGGARFAASAQRKIGCHLSGFILQALEWATAAGACPNTLPHLCAQG